MNKQHLEKLIQDTADRETEVSTTLHQNIMRAVRQVEPVTRKISPNWQIPAWGAAMTVAVFLLLQTTAMKQAPDGDLAQLEKPGTKTQLMTLENQLTAISKQTLAPEKELAAEIERLKSDLKRFDFRS